jgi:ABC-2 type transport system ATP-binding protein
VLGARVPDALSSVVHRVGSVIETPAMFPTMSARENLHLLGRTLRIGPRRVEEVLADVNLSDRAGEPVRRYSLGMRQRLGIAAALLREPDLLVLDEPANGLDPAGIREVRHLLRRLGTEGRTVLVSSHLLSEVEQTCDAVAIMHRGRCVRSGRVDEVLAKDSGALLVRVDDREAALAVLRRAGFSAALDGSAIEVAASRDRAAEVTRALATEQLWITELRPKERNLEYEFLALTEDTLTEDTLADDALTEGVPA